MIDLEEILDLTGTLDQDDHSADGGISVSAIQAKQLVRLSDDFKDFEERLLNVERKVSANNHTTKLFELNEKAIKEKKIIEETGENMIKAIQSKFNKLNIN